MNAKKTPFKKSFLDDKASLFFACLTLRVIAGPRLRSRIMRGVHVAPVTAVETVGVDCWVLICSMECRLARDAAGEDVRAYQVVFTGNIGHYGLKKECGLAVVSCNVLILLVRRDQSSIASHTRTNDCLRALGRGLVCSRMV